MPTNLQAIKKSEFGFSTLLLDLRVHCQRSRHPSRTDDLELISSSNNYRIWNPFQNSVRDLHLPDYEPALISCKAPFPDLPRFPTSLKWIFLLIDLVDLLFIPCMVLIRIFHSFLHGDCPTPEICLSFWACVK